MAQKSKSSSSAKSASINESYLLGALSYLWILSVLFYVLKKDDSFVQFHAKQGMVIFGISLIGLFPVLGWPLELLALVLIIIGGLKAYQGEKYKIPLVSEVAQKINF